MQNALNNNQALIHEYKEKNDTLNGLLTKYNDYADDNERLKIMLATTKDELTARATANQQLAHQLKAAEQLLVNTKEQHQTELSILSDKKDIERENP